MTTSIEIVKPDKTKAHTVYKTASGLVVPGASTIAGMLDKSFTLIPWAVKCTQEGKDWKEVRDQAGASGTLAHTMIMADLKKATLDTSNFSKTEIDYAETSYLYYLDWCKGKTIEPILIETPLISEQYMFGATPDFYGKVDGLYTLKDYKTGGIYDEAYYQTCGYRQVIIENGYPAPEQIIILGIPRNDKDKFKVEKYTSFDKGWQIFEHLLAIYWLKKNK